MKNRKTVILIQPKLSWQYKAYAALPLGLLSTVIFLHKEYNIKIIDQQIEKTWKKDILEILKKYDVLCIGIRCITGIQIKRCLEIAKFIKKHSNKKIVFGGVHPTISPEETLKNKNVDIIVKGEGEFTFNELVRTLDKKKKLEGIKGVWYKEKGKLKTNPERGLCDLNKLPEIPFHLINIERYIRPKSEFSIEGSRGCTHDCFFCYNTVFNKKKWRAITADKVIKRIKNIVEKYNVKHIYFIDDNFFHDKKRAEKIAENIINSGLNIEWSIQGARIDHLVKNDKLLKLLKKSNCTRMSLGVESGSQKILDMMKKKIVLSQVIEFNRKIKEYNITPYYYFSGGFPSESSKDIKNTFKLMFKLKKENPKAMFSPYYCQTPFQGTGLFKDSLKHGFKKPETLEEWSKFNWNKINTPWVSKKNGMLLPIINFFSLFIDNKGFSFIDSKYLKNLMYKFSMFYKPISTNIIKGLYRLL